MGRIKRFIKRLFGVYETGYEYWVNLKDIKVPPKYLRTRISKKKWNYKMGYWLRTGEFASKILLHKDFTLIDGYSSVKIAYLKGIDRVPVYFVDSLRKIMNEKK